MVRLVTASQLGYQLFEGGGVGLRFAPSREITNDFRSDVSLARTFPTEDVIIKTDRKEDVPTLTVLASQSPLYLPGHWTNSSLPFVH